MGRTRRFKLARLKLRRGTVKVKLASPSDLDLVLDFLRSCSRDSIYARYGHAVSLFMRVARRAVGMGGGWELSLIALVEEDGRERCVGLAECNVDPVTLLGEVSVLISDEWQGTGLGLNMLRLLLKLAKESGVTEVYGRVSLDNPRMVRLFKALGFRVRLSMENGEYRASLRLVD